MNRILKILPVLLLTVSLSARPAFAQSESDPASSEEENGIRLIADGFRYEGEVFVRDDAAYVSLREFACMADNSVVKWEEEEETARVTTDSLTLTASPALDYLEANGRILWCPTGVFEEGGTLYVPLQQTAQAFGFDAHYSEEEDTTYLTRLRGAIEPAGDYYDPDELYWLSKIIHAEAEGEPFLGKLAVGTVIRNRVDSEEFPDTIYEVIFDRENGTQFTPTANGAIEKEPGKESVLAAKICLENVRLSEEILYFLNVRLAASFWIVQNCTYIMTVGEHDFYAP